MRVLFSNPVAGESDMGLALLPLGTGSSNYGAYSLNGVEMVNIFCISQRYINISLQTDRPNSEHTSGLYSIGTKSTQCGAPGHGVEINAVYICRLYWQSRMPP